jgi:hypothetical protein
MVVSPVPEDDNTAETALRGALALRYNSVKPFLSLLGETPALGAATGGMRILTGVQRLPALSRRGIFASPSHRWSDPRARLLQGKGWDAVREDVLAALSLEENGEQHLKDLVEVLDETRKQRAERLEEAGSAVDLDDDDDGNDE